MAKARVNGIAIDYQDTPFLAPCEYVAKKIPGARLETIAGAGHSSNLDRPGAFNRVLLDFLDSLPPAKDASGPISLVVSGVH